MRRSSWMSAEDSRARRVAHGYLAMWTESEQRDDQRGVIWGGVVVAKKQITGLISNGCIGGSMASRDAAGASGTCMWRWGRIREDLEGGHGQSESGRAHGRGTHRGRARAHVGAGQRRRPRDIRAGDHRRYGALCRTEGDARWGGHMGDRDIFEFNVRQKTSAGQIGIIAATGDEPTAKPCRSVRRLRGGRSTPPPGQVEDRLKKQ